MDALFNWCTSASMGVVAIALMVAVLNPAVHDGVVVKAGLISMSLGFGSMALRTLEGAHNWDGIGMSRSVLLITGGVAIVIAGYLHRVRRVGHPLRRARSDWVERRSQGDRHA